MLRRRSHVPPFNDTIYLDEGLQRERQDLRHIPQAFGEGMPRRRHSDSNRYGATDVYWSGVLFSNGVLVLLRFYFFTGGELAAWMVVSLYCYEIWGAVSYAAHFTCTEHHAEELPAKLKQSLVAGKV